MKYLSILLLLLVLTAWNAGAKTVSLSGQSASITIPDDWIITTRPNVVLFAAAPGETTALGLLVSSNDDQRQANTDDFIRGMALGIVEKAKANGAVVKLIDAGPKVLNDVPAGFVETQQTFPNHQTIYSLAYTLAANGKIYRLSLDTKDSNNTPALAGIAASFRFAPPVQVPGPYDFIVHRVGAILGIALIIGLLVFFFRNKIREALGF